MEKQTLNIRSKKPSPVQVNRAWIIGLIALVGALLLLALMTVFSPKKLPASFEKNTSSQNSEAVMSPLLNSLPANYQDTKAMAKYFQSTTTPEMQNELAELRERQTTLQSQLINLQRLKAQSPLQAQNDLHRQEAETSGLFFPGGAPERQPASANSKNALNNAASTSGNAPPPPAYNQQNMQQQKMDFLKPSDQPEDIYNPHQLQTPVSPYEIQAGTIIPSVLITGVQSSLPGEVISQTRNDVYDTVTGQYLLIPKGSKLLGEYQSEVSYGQVRALIVFNRIVRPDGTSILLSKFTGADVQGEAGMQGNVDNHWSRVLGAATLSTILSMGAGIASDNQRYKDSDGNWQVNSKQSALLGAAGGISQVGQTLTNRAIDIQPTLNIPAGYEFNVIVNKDMIMAPYKS